MATFTYIPAPGASLAEKPAVEVAKYGEGYEQRVMFSINSQMNKWTLKFTQYVPEVLAFLRERNGVDSFNWTDPMGVDGVYVCREWKANHLGATYYDISCDFEQVPEVAAP
jgi:phage-related protein